MIKNTLTTLFLFVSMNASAAIVDVFHCDLTFNNNVTKEMVNTSGEYYGIRKPFQSNVSLVKNEAKGSIEGNLTAFNDIGAFTIEYLVYDIVDSNGNFIQSKMAANGVFGDCALTDGPKGCIERLRKFMIRQNGEPAIDLQNDTVVEKNPQGVSLLNSYAGISGSVSSSDVETDAATRTFKIECKYKNTIN